MKRIVVDSSASLYALDGIDFASVPLKIVTDEREYLDDGTLDAVEMATDLRTYKGKTSTSCPNIGDWLEAYEGADEIYAITITGTLSGSCNAAQLAAEEYQAEHPEARVFVLDSLSAGPELVLLAEHIRALIKEGRDFDDVCEEMLRYRHHTHLLFSLESLANLARNGRIKPTVAAVARMLNIRVIGKASDVGELDVLCKTRGEHGALERIVLELKGHGYTNGKVIIAHCGNPAAAIARQVGVDQFFAEVLPEDKAAFVQKAKSEGHTVVMIGDGINDSPALSAADVGIAINSGAAIAREIADVTIKADSLEELVILKTIANSLQRRVSANYRFVLTFNSALIALGAMGILQPASSAMLHNLSTIGISLKSMTNLIPEEKAQKALAEKN